MFKIDSLFIIMSQKAMIQIFKYWYNSAHFQHAVGINISESCRDFWIQPSNSVIER